MSLFSHPSDVSHSLSLTSRHATRYIYPSQDSLTSGELYELVRMTAAFGMEGIPEGGREQWSNLRHIPLPAPLAHHAVRLRNYNTVVNKRKGKKIKCWTVDADADGAESSGRVLPLQS